MYSLFVSLVGSVHFNGFVYRILLNKHAHLNNPTFDFPWPYLRNFYGSQSNFQHLKDIREFTLLGSLKSDNDTGSFSASEPGAFIQQNMVYG